MANGVSWFYNWSERENNPGYSIYDSGMAFLPMCWNGGFDETKLRAYLDEHKGKVKFLLAFNEPNLSTAVGGSAMTPQQAAEAWPKVEKIAEDYGLEIVAPALNFTGDKVGERVWQPFEWYDEFFRLVPDAKIDYLAFHSYMNYYSAVDWVASRYFYCDIDTKDESDLMGATNRAKYPNLVKYMDGYHALHGHYPRMFLTEFCSWESNSYPYQAGLTRDFQIDQMTQKVQMLEKNDNVKAYAWFMANTANGYSEFPYMSVFEDNTAESELSELGSVYVNMSSFDTSKYYSAGDIVLAKDYIDASLDEQQIRLRTNCETGSNIPLQAEWQPGTWAKYLVDVPSDGEYVLTLHVKSTQENDIRLYRDAFGAANKLHTSTIPSTNGKWQDVDVKVSLQGGRYGLLIYNMGDASILMNKWILKSVSAGVASVISDKGNMMNFYSLSGIKTGKPDIRGIYITNGRKYAMK